jgi:hypothetical protein
MRFNFDKLFTARYKNGDVVFKNKFLWFPTFGYFDSGATKGEWRWLETAKFKKTKFISSHYNPELGYLQYWTRVWVNR